MLLVDPMLATGGSVSAIDSRKRGCNHIVMLCLVAAPEGVSRLLESHPMVPVHAAVLDDKLDENGIVPGLGDAGDRAFGTL